MQFLIELTYFYENIVQCNLNYVRVRGHFEHIYILESHSSVTLQCL